MAVNYGDIGSFPISSPEILAQTERILMHRSFAHSSVFKRFLRFLVRESLADRTNKLKEYTIAREVLDKPITFNAQEDCIVRVHAMRLRRALDLYYQESSKNNDLIRITIPKGHYTPVFSRISEGGVAMGEFEEDYHNELDVADRSGIPSLAIFPFNYSGMEPDLMAFAEGLGIELSAALGENHWCSVMSYELCKSAFAGRIGKEPSFTVSGDLRHQANRIRVSVELSRNVDRQHIWGGIFERTWSNGDSFLLQDELVGLILGQLRRCISSGKTGSNITRMISVA